MRSPHARPSSTRKLLLAAFSLALCIGAGLGCGGTSGPGTSDGGSSQQSCSEQHACVNGSCTCTTGPNKDQSCCDPSDSACSNSSTRCDKYCQVCQ